MLSTRLILIAAFAAFGATAGAATKPEAKPAAKKEAKAAASPRLRGKQETLACRLGTEDRHARIAVVTIGGKVDSFAYYSKWKPRTCSVYLQRNRDMYSKWADNGNLTTVDIEKGAFIVENRKNEYHFIFRGIDRERYCGMDGTINGTLTIKKGSEACELGGDIMVEGTPLGQAFVQREEDKPPVGLLPVTPQEAAKAPRDVSPPAAPVAPEKPAEAEKQPATAAPAAATGPTTPVPTTSPSAAPAAAAATNAPSAPIPSASNAPSAPAAAATNAAGAPSTAAIPTQSAPAPAAASLTAKREPEKTAEPASSNPFRSFFRSLGESKGPQTTGAQ